MLATSFTELNRHNETRNSGEELGRILGGKKKYGMNSPIPLKLILDEFGLSTAIVALCACPGHERIASLFAIECACSAHAAYEEKRPGDNRLMDAIEAMLRAVDGVPVPQSVRMGVEAAGEGVMGAKMRKAVLSVKNAMSRPKSYDAALHCHDNAAEALCLDTDGPALADPEDLETNLTKILARRLLGNDSATLLGRTGKKSESTVQEWLDSSASAYGF